jgi:hypothetical protein
MMLHIVLGSAVLLALVCAGGLLLAVIGIHRGDRGKRLTGRPAGLTEAFARRMLTGSRDCGTSSDAREDP